MHAPFFKPAICALLLSGGLLPAGLQAKPTADSAVPNQAVSQPNQWQQVALHDSWGLLCDSAAKKNCRIVQSQVVNDHGDPRRLLLVVAWREAGKVGLSITVPLGVDVRAGLAMKIGDGAERQLRFFTCGVEGCQTSMMADPQMEKELHTAAGLRVGFIPYGVEKPVVVNAPLKGFKEAMDALPAG